MIGTPCISSWSLQCSLKHLGEALIKLITTDGALGVQNRLKEIAERELLPAFQMSSFNSELSKT
jgi:hypothetical protein